MDFAQSICCSQKRFLHPGIPYQHVPPAAHGRGLHAVGQSQQLFRHRQLLVLLAGHMSSTSAVGSSGGASRVSVRLHSSISISQSSWSNSLSRGATYWFQNALAPSQDLSSCSCAATQFIASWASTFGSGILPLPLPRPGFGAAPSCFGASRSLSRRSTAAPIAA